MLKTVLKSSLALFLSVLMVLSAVTALSTAPSVKAASENYNEYEKMLESIKPENNYGLEDTVNDGKIIQAWNWSYKNIIANLETLAEQGFTTIQVSPPNEIKMPTKGVKVCEPAVDGIAPNGWWMFYQPAGFQLNESTDNALGVKAEFVEMCEEAHRLGLKIIVDTVVNYMGTDDDHIGAYDNTSTDPMAHVTPRAAEFEPELIAAKAFHTPWVKCQYIESFWDGTEHDIEQSMTQHSISGLPDLATETQVVQNAIYEYLEELVLAGADGFRFDAAKHIETRHDTYYASDFWDDTLLKLRSEYPDKEIYAYGEILNKCGDGRPFSQYTELMDVTDSSSYWGIKDAVVNGGGNPIPFYGSESDGTDPTTVNFTKENVIQWNESHDTYIDGSTSSLTVQQRNKIWALTAARQTITGIYFARPDDRTGANREAIEAICANITLGDANKTSWTAPEVAAVNQFDNYFQDAPEYNSNQNNVVMIERGGLGATLVNLTGTSKTVNLKHNTLSNGTYIDAITGNEFEVADGKVTGNVGSTGIACIYYAQDTEPEVPEEPVITNPYDIEVTGSPFPIVDGYNTVVYSAKQNWTEAYVYAWITGTDINCDSWPGTPMKKVTDDNGYGEKQYIAYIPVEYENYIINNGKSNNEAGGAQTVDLTVTSSVGMYMNYTNSDGKWTIGTWEPSFYEMKIDKAEGTLSNGLSYSEKTVGEIAVTGYSGGSDYVVIPEEIEGLPVTSISTGVFTGDVARVYIPASVTVIEDSAFTSGDVHIFYPGTSSEWKSSITIGEGNDIVYDGTRHYNVIDSDVYASTVVESTCKEKGYTVYTCSICGDSYKIYTTALAQHNYLSDVVAPTCKEQGYTLYTCSVCGYSYKDDYIDQVSHNIIDGKCTYCNQEYEIVESAHNYAPDTDKTWVLSKAGATSITLDFSSDTFVENKYDYIYLYDENDVQIGKYTGSELASASVVVNGSVAKIRLVSDDSGNYYGFHATVVYEMIETNRIYLTTPSSWSGANIYGFYGVLGETCTYEPFGAYPGTAMDYVKTDENGQKVYCADIPADIDYIKFTDGTGTYPNYRTDNIPASLIYDNVVFKITTMGTKYWNYTTDVPEETTTTDPTEPGSVESVYYLRGTMCGWEPGKVMTLNSDGSASITLSLSAGEYEFKIYNNSTGGWFGSTGTIADTAEGWTFIGGVGNCTLNATGGTYTFKCYTDSDGKFKVDVTKLSPEEPTEATVSTEPEESTAHVESTVTPTVAPAFSGASLTLQDNLCINFKANETLFTEVGYENPYVVFELNGEEFTVSDYEVVSGKYVFDFADIAPNNMNDTVKATLYATFDGVEYVSETREYSVATYCYNMLNKYTTPAYAELQTLLVDLLNYGAMSQIYTGHNTDNLVNAKLTDAQKAWGTVETPTYESVQNLAYKTIANPTVQWKGGGLNLVDAVTMRFKISANSGSYENLVVKAETDDRIWTIPYEEFSETTGGYYVYFSGLNAGEMSETVYLTVYENGEAVSNTLSYSIESYAYSKQTSTDTNLVNLLEAMMKYGNSAFKYANPDYVEEETTTAVPETTAPAESDTNYARTDFREETIYSVITTRFYDGDKGNNVHCWNDGQAGNPDTDPAWRGDFKGLAEKLDYIKALGFSAVLITPVVENASGYDYKGYHPINFSKVDPRYESSDFTYQDLIDAAHERGIKIIQNAVWNHTSNFGEAYFAPLFTKQYNTIQDLASVDCMKVVEGSVLDNLYPSYANLNADYQFLARLNVLKSDTIDTNYFYHHDGTLSYGQPAEQTGQIASDCVDVNTENPAVAKYITDTYMKYADMGVDALFVDDVRHINRWTLNKAYFPAFNKLDNFFVFSEVLSRYHGAFNEGGASDSCFFYTWNEDDTAAQWSHDWNENYNSAISHFKQYHTREVDWNSNNAFLDGINYHTPDYSRSNGTAAVDFSMQWAFNSANEAFNVALSGDRYYNDSTWSVVRVDSMEYGTDDYHNTRYSGGTQAWAENLNLLFTFRGIPCVFYGSEVEFQKDKYLDIGPNAPLAETGHAYYGDYLEGTVTATDFSEYTATGEIKATLESPLAKHITKLNAVRRAIPALQKGQYTSDSKYASGSMAYVRRFTDKAEGIDSLALVAASGSATFRNIPNGIYIDAITGDKQTVTNGTLITPTVGKGNMRVYVCCAEGFTGITGAIGETNLTYLK